MPYWRPELFDQAWVEPQRVCAWKELGSQSMILRVGMRVLRPLSLESEQPTPLEVKLCQRSPSYNSQSRREHSFVFQAGLQSCAGIPVGQTVTRA